MGPFGPWTVKHENPGVFASCSVGRHSDVLSVCGCDRVLGLLNSAILGSWSLFHRDRFLCTFHRACQNDRRSFSRRSWWCLGVHNSRSASIQIFAVQLETDTFCCTILLLTSWPPPFRCTSHVKCCEGWSRLIGSERTAILCSEQPSNYTNTLCSGVSSKFVCTLQSWASSCRNHSLDNDRCTLDSRPWRTPHVSLSWRLGHPMSSEKSLGNNTLSCNVGLMCFPPEWPSIARRYRMVSAEYGSIQYWNHFLGPPPFCKYFSHVRIDQCWEDVNSERNICAKILNSTASSSSRGTEGSCRSNLIILFDTSNNSCRTDLVPRQSKHADDMVT